MTNHATPDCGVLVGDCVTVLSALPAGCAALVYADPPFNQGVGYEGYGDDLTPQAYLAFTDRWLAAVRRVLSPTGSLFVQIADEWAGYLQVRLDALGLSWRNTVVWHYAFGPHLTRKFGRDHQQLLYYTADPDRFTFNADAVRVPSARQTVYRDRRANPKGRVPGDVWTFSRVCGTFKERTGHACQTPLALLERVVLACSDPGDLVLDPFAGSGSTLVVAKRLGRRWLGVEVSPAAAAKIRERLG